MVGTTAPLALLTFAGAVFAAPKGLEQRDYVVPTISPDLGTAIGGAIDIANGATPPTPTVAPSVAHAALAPAYVTISIVNKRNVPISTSHAGNANAPTPIWGDNGPGTIAAGATAAFAVPTGWAGNVAIIDAVTQNGQSSLPENGDNSLIEGSFVVTPPNTDAIADIDVSYVDGFSGAISCSCDGTVVTGCNAWLWDLHSCPDDNGVGACKNPLRASNSATAPTDFFAPCAGAAYTFPNDNGANSYGACQSGTIVCCVGADCPRNPRQP